jgi:hypothetical protein
MDKRDIYDIFTIPDNSKKQNKMKNEKSQNHNLDNNKVINIINNNENKLLQKIDKSLFKLYNDLINNTILIFFFESKTQTDFIKKIKHFSKKKDKHNLNLIEINKFKLLYNILKKQCKSNKTYKLTHKKINQYKTKTQKQKKTKNKKTKKGGTLIKNVDGGPYLERLTSKGKEPITGNDVKQSLDEIKSLLEKYMYIEEGRWVKKPNMVLNYLMGDDSKLKYYIKTELLPQYVNFNTFLPKINLNKILNKLSNITSLISLYETDNQIKKKYISDKGLNPNEYLKSNKYTSTFKKIKKLDENFRNLQRQTRMNYSLAGRL